MIHHFATIEDVDIYFSWQDGSAVMRVEDIDKLTPEKIQKISEKKERLEKLSFALDVMTHAGYSTGFGSQFFDNTTLVLLATFEHNDERAKEAAVQMLEDRGINLSDLAMLIKPSKMEGESE